MGRLVGVRILVVNDEPDSLRALCAVLELEAAKTDCVASPEAAVEAARSHRPDVVVADLRMAGDGITLPQILDAPCIAYSGDHTSAERARAAGFHCFLLKPVDPRRLIETICQLVGIR